MTKIKVPKGEKNRNPDEKRHYGSVETIQSRKIDIEEYTKFYISEQLQHIISAMESGRVIDAHRGAEHLKKMIHTTGKILDVVKYYTLDESDQIKSLKSMYVFEEIHRSTSFKPDLYHDIPRPIADGARKKLHVEMIKDLERFGYTVEKTDVKK